MMTHHDIEQFVSRYERFAIQDAFTTSFHFFEILIEALKNFDFAGSLRIWVNFLNDGEGVREFFYLVFADIISEI